MDRPELRALMHRVLSVEGERLQALSKRDDRYVIAVAGGRSKVDAVRGALRGRFMNVLVTDEDVRGRPARALSAQRARRADFLVRADAAELLVAVGRRSASAESSRQRRRAARGAPPAGWRPRLPVAMGAAHGLRHDRVDDPEPQQVGRGDPHRLGRLGRLGRVAPQDGGAALGRDHRVDGVLEHQHAVAHADGERAAAAPLAGDDRDDRHPQAGHLRAGCGRSPRACPRSSAPMPGIGARRVDEGDDRACRTSRPAASAAAALR